MTVPTDIVAYCQVAYTALKYGDVGLISIAFVSVFENIKGINLLFLVESMHALR